MTAVDCLRSFRYRRPICEKRGHLANSKLDAIEWVRVAAACGVVWFHINDGPCKELGYAGLICFILISVVFQATGSDKDTFGAYLWKKLIRIAPPWLFWFVFYGLINLAKGKSLFPSSDGIVANILTGPWIGLWYLPFIFLASPIVFGLAAVTSNLGPLWRATGFLFTGMVMLYLFPQLSTSRKIMEPWVQWNNALSAIPIGLGIYGVLQATGKTRITAMLILIVLVEVVCLAILNANRPTAVIYGVAVPVVGLSLLIPFGLPHAITRLGELCLGVYLMHSAVLAVLKFVPVVGALPWFLFSAGIVSSFTATALIRKNPWFAKVI